jgi:hypothetical protein
MIICTAKDWGLVLGPSATAIAAILAMLFSPAISAAVERTKRNEQRMDAERESLDESIREAVRDALTAANHLQTVFHAGAAMTRKGVTAALATCDASVGRVRHRAADLAFRDTSPEQTLAAAYEEILAQLSDILVVLERAREFDTLGEDDVQHHVADLLSDCDEARREFIRLARGRTLPPAPSLRRSLRMVFRGDA